MKTDRTHISLALLESFPTATGEADVALTDSFINTLPTKGPFTGRLVTNGLLKAPMFTVGWFLIFLFTVNVVCR